MQPNFIYKKNCQERELTGNPTASHQMKLRTDKNTRPIVQLIRNWIKNLTMTRTTHRKHNQRMNENVNIYN